MSTIDQKVPFKSSLALLVSDRFTDNHWRRSDRSLAWIFYDVFQFYCDPFSFCLFAAMAPVDSGKSWLYYKLRLPSV